MIESPFTETFSFSGNKMETVLAKGRERTLLSGEATLASENTKIYADNIEIYGENFQYAISTGNVHVIYLEEGIELTSDSLFYNRENGVSRTQGNATLIDRKNEIVAKGGHIEDRPNRDETIIQIGVRILSEDIIARAEFVRYNRGDNTLELSGLPILTWKGDEYQASRIFLDIKGNNVRLEGTVTGEISNAVTPALRP